MHLSRTLHAPNYLLKDAPTNVFWNAVKKSISIKDSERELKASNTPISQTKLVYTILREGIMLKKVSKSIEDIITAINEQAKGYKFVVHDNKVSYIIEKGSFFYTDIEINKHCAAILGLTETEQTFDSDGNSVYTGQFAPSFNYGKTRMFIYSDIAEHQFVGDQMAPLLRIATYDGRNDKITTIGFTHLHYIPVSKNYIEFIHMYIRSETGETLPFETGTFSATLHFRQRRY